MLEIRARVFGNGGQCTLKVRGALRLPFEQRRKSRLHARLESGEEVALILPRGTVLRGGDLLAASNGGVIEVVAEPEALLHVECTGSEALARAAYHLGNRHVPVQVGEGWLRIAADHVLAGMLEGLGAAVTPIEAPFEPEVGAYADGHHHHADGEHHGRIHDHAAPGHER